MLSRYSIKIIGSVPLLEKAISNYDINWNLESILGHKEPLMIAVSGAMAQQPIGKSFLGTTLEEKFHVKCSSLNILPCLPLVPEVLRGKVHPDVSDPTFLQDDVKSGYFLVNLSLNQAFGEPEYKEADDSEDGNEG